MNQEWPRSNREKQSCGFTLSSELSILSIPHGVMGKCLWTDGEAELKVSTRKGFELEELPFWVISRRGIRITFAEGPTRSTTFTKPKNNRQLIDF